MTARKTIYNARDGARKEGPHKVRMVMELPESSDELMNSFKSKLRSQIRKPIKEGVETRIGQTELLDDFYHVFAINMKDLGSPVHSKRLFHNILKEFLRQFRGCRGILRQETCGRRHYVVF